MGEYIDRTTVLSVYKQTEVEAILFKKSWQDTWKSLGDNLKRIPSEVVLCNQCTYWENAKANKKGFLICPASGMEITADDFCSYGERKNNG